jgi:hypothetical protein
MFTYSDNTNYNLNFYYFIVPIFNWDVIYSAAIIHVSDVSDGIFTCRVQRRSQRPLSMKRLNLRYLLQWLICVESCGCEKPLRGECNCLQIESTRNLQPVKPRILSLISSAYNLLFWGAWLSWHLRASKKMWTLLVWKLINLLHRCLVTVRHIPVEHFFLNSGWDSFPWRQVAH